MSKIIAYENSYIELDNENTVIINDLIGISNEIKSELGLTKDPIRFMTKNTIYIGNIIGRLSLNTTTIKIYPKYVGNEDVDHARYSFETILNRAIKCCMSDLKSVIYFFRKGVYDDSASELFDVMSRYYVEVTLKALKKSKICLYEEHVDKIRNIKGRILSQKQLSDPVKDEKTWCRYKSLSSNNIYNQLLGWACKYLLEITKNIEIKRKLIALSREFPMETNLVSRKAISTLKVPRQFNEYKECIQLAQNLFLYNGNKSECLNGKNKVCGYAINMERTFQNIVEYYSRIAARKNTLYHRPQATISFAEDLVENSYGYNVMPDNLIFKNDKKIIFDAKYKIVSMSEGKKYKPSIDDFYQMVGSCIAHKCHEAVLIYPSVSGFSQGKWKLNNKVNGEYIKISSASIDVDAKEIDIINQISAIIRNSDFYKEVANE